MAWPASNHNLMQALLCCRLLASPTAGSPLPARVWLPRAICQGSCTIWTGEALCWPLWLSWLARERAGQYLQCPKLLIWAVWVFLCMTNLSPPGYPRQCFPCDSRGNSRRAYADTRRVWPLCWHTPVGAAGVSCSRGLAYEPVSANFWSSSFCMLPACVHGQGKAPDRQSLAGLGSCLPLSPI